MLSKVISFADSSETLKELRKNVTQMSLIKEILIFIVLIIIINVLSGIIRIPIFIVFSAFPDLLTLVSLFSGIIKIALIFLVIMLIEKRSLASIGFSRKNITSSLLKGFAIGFLMFFAIVVIGLLLGQYSFEGISPSFSLMIIPFLLGFAVQSFGEEIYTRGWIMTYFSKRHTVLIGFLINSIIFVIIHASNEGFNAIAGINIFIVGIFLSILFWKYDIWICGAFHTIWNFTQGCIFGFNISGAVTTPTLLSFNQVNQSVIGGGYFGPESSLITTAILIIGVIVAYYYPKKSND